MRVKTFDGIVIEGDTFEDIANALWQQVLVPEPSLHDWMVENAQRAEMWDGTVLPVSSVEDHIRAMIAAGHLVELSD